MAFINVTCHSQSREAANQPQYSNDRKDTWIQNFTFIKGAVPISSETLVFHVLTKVLMIPYAC